MNAKLKVKSKQKYSPLKYRKKICHFYVKSLMGQNLCMSMFQPGRLQFMNSSDMLREDKGKWCSDVSYLVIYCITSEENIFINFKSKLSPK